MPKIGEISGVSIYIYYNDHDPPHFHVIYNDKEASIQISSCAILKGNLPPSVMRIVREWTIIHKKELLEIWRYATEHKILPKIPPLH